MNVLTTISVREREDIMLKKKIEDARKNVKERSEVLKNKIKSLEFLTENSREQLFSLLENSIALFELNVNSVERDMDSFHKLFPGKEEDEQFFKILSETIDCALKSFELDEGIINNSLKFERSLGR